MLQKVLSAVLCVLGIAGLILSGIQFVMAIRFGELGRVVVYLTLGILCAELVVIVVGKILEQRKN